MLNKLFEPWKVLYVHVCIFFKARYGFFLFSNLYVEIMFPKEFENILDI